MKIHQLTRKTALISGLVAMPSTSTAHAQIGRVTPKSQVPYLVETQTQRGDKPARLILRNTRTNEIVWSHLPRGEEQVIWSPNRRALLLDTGRGFFVWREGHRLREFAIPARTFFDYSMGFVWSPDNQRILVRFGASASSDFDAARMFCLRLGRGDSYKYSTADALYPVRKMAWRSPRTALYWLVNMENGVVLKKPRVWQVP